MRFIKIFAIAGILPFIYCSKSNSGTPAQTSHISLNNVTQARDSNNSTVTFIVSVEPANPNAITVNYSTVDGTAKANEDFVPASGTLTINPNSTQATVEVQVKGRKLQGIQEFYLQLSNPKNATIKFDKGTAKLENAGFGYQLAWSDEFNTNALNTADWNYETGGTGWGNNELQNYTAGTNNAYIENGNLVIEAKKETSGNNQYSSARITSKGKRKFTYGKIEIRAKVPATKGLWPALWMLGENIDQVSWPACGEIDIMEMVNKESPSKTYGTAHWGVNSASHLSSTGSYTLSSGFFADDYHVYSVEWDASKIQWFMDGNKFHELSRQQVTGGNLPFDKDFFLIMNVAVGGNWPGNPDATSVFPQKMYVDWVRVYQK